MRKLKKLYKRFSTGQRKVILENIGWLYSENVLQYVLGFLVGIWVARYLGPKQFGLYNYVIAFLFLFSVFTELGIRQLTVRDLVKHPSEKEKIIGSVVFLKFIGGVVTVFLAVGLISLLRPGEDLVRLLVMILAIGTIFQAFGTIDFWFQSKIQSKYSVWARNIAYIIVSLGRVVLIVSKAPLIAFIWMRLAENVLQAIGLAAAYRLKGYYLRAWRCSFEYIKKLLVEGWPLVLTTISVTIYMSIDKVMLGQMIGSHAVGIYSAATKVGFIWIIIPTAIINSVFPLIVKSKQMGEELYYARIQTIFNIVAAIGLSVAVVLTFFSSRLVIFLYGSSYAGAGPVLAIYVWSVLFATLGSASTVWIITEGRTKFALATRASGLIINVSLNWLLIPLYREIGAAVATVVSHIIIDYLSLCIYSPARKVGRLMTRALAFGIVYDWKRDFAE